MASLPFPPVHAPCSSVRLRTEIRGALPAIAHSFTRGDVAPRRSLLRRRYFLLARFLDDAAHGIGRLGAVLDPVVDARQIDVRVVARLLRIVVAHELDELPITRAALIGD